MGGLAPYEIKISHTILIEKVSKIKVYEGSENRDSGVQGAGLRAPHTEGGIFDPTLAARFPGGATPPRTPPSGPAGAGRVGVIARGVIARWVINLFLRKHICFC